jgi:hypothetical protein
MACCVAAVVFTFGCAQEEEEQQSGPTGEERATLETGEGAMTLAKSVMQIASTAVVDAGSDGAESAASAEASGDATKPKAPSGTISYSENVVLVVDLNTVNPNFTGTITIEASGSVVGDEFAGSVDYAVDVHRDTHVTYTNPENGDTITALAGDGIDFDLSVEWTKTDDQNWSIDAESTASRTDLPLTIVKGGTTITATLSGYRHRTCALSMTEGVLAVACHVDGWREVTFTDGVESHTVRVDVMSLAEIYVTIDGVQFGPYNWLQVLILYRMHVD